MILYGLFYHTQNYSSIFNGFQFYVDRPFCFDNMMHFTGHFMSTTCKLDCSMNVSIQKGIENCNNKRKSLEKFICASRMFKVKLNHNYGWLDL